MSRKLFSINSSNDGSGVPSNGVLARAGDTISITGGTNIAGELQRLYKSGWHRVPDQMADISGPYQVTLNTPGKYRIFVTSAVGNWDFEVIN